MVHQGLTRRSWLSRWLPFAVFGGVGSVGAGEGVGRPFVGVGTLPAPERLAPFGSASPRWPEIPREFRAAWVATVANIDWPSRRGLSAQAQQAEMRRMLDQAQALGLNAIVLQVRPSADALYPSSLEPWSEFLTGEQGQSPGYDPLALWIEEAHRRGLELHAWFNPYRARVKDASSPAAASHISRTRPAVVKSYGGMGWMDPGEPEAAAHTLAVFADVLRRYDVDGIHIDDYFYPYPVNDPATRAVLDFPDEASWGRYLQGGGRLSRADWRRQNVDRLVQDICALKQSIKPWVRFGVSPFGVGKPVLRPPGIAGFSQFDQLYADVERWLAEGWLDYLVPQLYWPRAQAAQAFGRLLAYWHGVNPRGRHVWAGLYTSRVGAPTGAWSAEEIEAQVEMVRTDRPGTGHVHFSMIALSQDRDGLATRLRRAAYAQDALPPACPWLEPDRPAAPHLVAVRQEGTLHLMVRDGGHGATMRRWALWVRRAGVWRFYAPTGGSWSGPREGVDAVAVAALSRVGQEGAWAAFSLEPERARR